MGQEGSPPGIDREWVIKASKLSRLSLSEQEIEELLPQLGQILEHVDILRSISTEGVEPFVHPLLELLPGSAARSLRPDATRSGEQKADGSQVLLSAAPEITDRAFQVPQAISQSGSRSK